MNIAIYFYLDNTRFAFRVWGTAPRVGDEVKLGKSVYRVKRVVWGVEGPEEERLGRQGANIEIEAVEP